MSIWGKIMTTLSYVVTRYTDSSQHTSARENLREGTVRSLPQRLSSAYLGHRTVRSPIILLFTSLTTTTDRK